MGRHFWMRSRLTHPDRVMLTHDLPSALILNGQVNLLPPATANSNVQSSNLTVKNLGLGAWNGSLCTTYCRHLHPLRQQERRKTGRKCSHLEEPRVGREEKGARERPLIKGSIMPSQSFHHFNALSCSDVSLCMGLPRPLFPVSAIFLASSQLNTHWNSREEVPHWALHNMVKGADERTCLF